MKARYLLTKYLLGSLFIKLIRRYKNCNGSFIKILVYHNIPLKDFDRFRSQIEHITNCYEFVDPQSFQELITGQKQSTNTKVLITFDDGFKSNAIVAEKILQPLGIKAIFFIPAGFIDIPDFDRQKIFITKNMFNNRLKPQDIPDDMKPMTWADIERLLKMGHTVGAHTINHRKLTEIEMEDELRNEIAGSGDLLEKKLGVKINHFACPFGSIHNFDKRAMKIIKERYKFCFSSIRGKNCNETNPYAILRDPISLNDPTQYVRFLIEDGLGWKYNRHALSLNNLATADPLFL